MNGLRAKVCIIGAGTAGLSALKNSLERPELEVVCYEQDKQLGGTWVYQEHVSGQDESEVHSSMYKNLRYDYLWFTYINGNNLQSFPVTPV